MKSSPSYRKMDSVIFFQVRLCQINYGSFEIFDLFLFKDESFHETETVNDVVMALDVQERQIR